MSKEKSVVAPIKAQPPADGSRPTAQDLETLVRQTEVGVPSRDILTELDISNSTLNRWKARVPFLREDLQRAEQFAHRLKQIETMAGLGLTMAEVGLCLGVQPGTFYVMRQDHRVEEAYYRGKAFAKLSTSKVLFQMATQEKNLAAIQWYEKTRQQMSETITVRSGAEADIQAAMATATREQLEQIAAGADPLVVLGLVRV